MKRNYKIDFDKKTLEINFDGETHKIDLTEGDAEDNWNSFKNQEGKIYDVNAYFDNGLDAISPENLKVVLYETISEKSSENFSNFIVLQGSFCGEIKNYIQ